MAGYELCKDSLEELFRLSERVQGLMDRLEKQEKRLDKLVDKTEKLYRDRALLLGYMIGAGFVGAGIIKLAGCIW